MAEKIGEYKVSSFNKTKYYSLLHREQLLFLFVSNSVKKTIALNCISVGGWISYMFEASECSFVDEEFECLPVQL